MDIAPLRYKWTDWMDICGWDIAYMNMNNIAKVGLWKKKEILTLPHRTSRSMWKGWNMWELCSRHDTSQGCFAKPSFIGNILLKNNNNSTNILLTKMLLGPGALQVRNETKRASRYCWRSRRRTYSGDIKGIVHNFFFIFDQNSYFE